MYQVVKTGSTGNAVIYFGGILLDCGVPFSALKPYLKKIQIILLTHQHKDHINLSTLKKICKDHPSIRVGCCEWMVELLPFVKNLDVYKIGEVFDYKAFQVCPVMLYHDVPNCGYRIFFNGKKVFHATDTASLSGIEAKNYDLYAIEHNYNEDTIWDIIAEQEAQGKFAHQRGSINSHLSEQQAGDFIFNNRGENSQVLRLHESKSSLSFQTKHFYDAI